MLAFEPFARLLHFLHWLGGIATVGTCTHLLVRLLYRSRHGKLRKARVRLHALILAISYASTWILGTLIYPTFRVRVRADLLDKTYPWATGLFEIKEHAATLIVFPVIAIYAMGRKLDFSNDQDRRYSALFIGLVCIVLSVTIYNACVGWYLGTLRSV
jgi:hypothetical protein